MKLTAFAIDGQPFEVRPASFERKWMDDTHERSAYRCLPLNIANAHGWELICPAGFSAVWHGKRAQPSLVIQPDAGAAQPAFSHFGYGVLTFPVPALFRTEPGYDLMVQGPVNRPKDGVTALAGLVETDWAPFTFTMNWAFTRPGLPVRFEKGEPYCHVFPVKRGELEAFEPDVRPLSADPELKAAYEGWAADRAAFNDKLRQSELNEAAKQWQKNYYRGVDASGEMTTAEGRRTRVRLKPFSDGR